MSRISQPSQVQLLKAAFRARQADIRTSCPGVVVSYDATTQTCTCNLAVNLPDVNGVPQDIPPLTDVPVKWQRGGGFFASMPLAAGDVGLLVFCEADFSAWRVSGEVSDAVQERRHGLYAYFLPGGGVDAHPIGDASADHMVCGKDGGPLIRIKSTGIELGASATHFAAEADAIMTNLSNLKTWLDSHVHIAAGPTSPTGPASAAATGPSPTASDVACTKVKIE